MSRAVYSMNIFQGAHDMQVAKIHEHKGSDVYTIERRATIEPVVACL